jgi:hypothetical protein
MYNARLALSAVNCDCGFALSRVACCTASRCGCCVTAQRCVHSFSGGLLVLVRLAALRARVSHRRVAVGERCCG